MIDRPKHLYFALACLIPISLTGCAQIEALRTRVADQDKIIKRLQEENSQFQDAYYEIKSTLESELSKSDQTVERLRRDLEQAKNLKSQKEIALNDQLRTRTLELDALGGEMKTLRALNEAEVARLQRQIQALSAERDASLAELTKRDEQLRDEQGRTKQLTGETAQQKVELQTQKDRIAVLTRDLDASQASLAEHDQQLADERQAHQQTTQRLTETDAQWTTSKDQATKLQSEVADLTQQLAALQTRAADVDQKLTQAQTQQSSASGENQQLMEKLTGLEQEMTKLKADHVAQLAAAHSAATSLADDPELAEAATAFQQRLAAMADDAPAKEIVVQLDARGLRLIVPSNILFQPDSIALSDQSPAVFEPILQSLAGLPDRELRVEGHTDDQPVQKLPFADNWGLGFARADRVREHLMRQVNVPGARLTALSRSHFDPLTDNTTPENRARNRRVEIVIGRKLAP